MREFIVFLCLSFFLSGCQRAQLTYATNTGAEAVQPFFTQQALDNLSALLDRPGSLPSQININGGTMQANSSYTPSLTFPLTSMFATLDQVGSTATGVTKTISGTKTTAGSSSTFSASYGFQLQFTVLPVTDPIALRNLQVIYMQILCNNMRAAPGYCSDFDLLSSYVPPRMYDASNDLIYDPYYITPPFCVLCSNANNPTNISIGPENAQTYLSPAKLFTDHWLYWTGPGTNPNLPASRNKPDDAVYIGSSRGRSFYARDYEHFARFLLDTLPLTYPSPTRTGQSTPLHGEGGAGAGAGGAGLGGEGIPGGAGLRPGANVELLVPYSVTIPGSTEAAPSHQATPSQGILPAPSQ